MKAYDMEFTQAQIMFEKIMKQDNHFNSRVDRISTIDREKVPKDIWYNNGETNKLFHMFLQGLEYGRCLYQE